MNTNKKLTFLGIAAFICAGIIPAAKTRMDIADAANKIKENSREAFADNVIKDGFLCEPYNGVPASGWADAINLRASLFSYHSRVTDWAENTKGIMLVSRNDAPISDEILSIRTAKAVILNGNSDERTILSEAVRNLAEIEKHGNVGYGSAIITRKAGNRNIVCDTVSVQTALLQVMSGPVLR